jgi:hypothetical protein
VVALIGQAVTVGHALGFARDCDVHIIAVAALAGLKEVLGRMLDARQAADAAVHAPSEGPWMSRMSRRRGCRGGIEELAGAARHGAQGYGDTAAPTQRGGSAVGDTVEAAGGSERGGAQSPWLMPSERLADELLTFFVRGVFTEDAR